MTATQALRVFTHGRRVRVPYLGTTARIEGSSLMMETWRGGRGRKLVLYVKLRRDDTGQTTTLPSGLLAS